MERKKLGDYQLDPIELEPFHRGWYAYLHCAKKESFSGAEGEKEAWERGWGAAQEYCMYQPKIKAV